MLINQLKVGAILSYVVLFLNNIVGIIYTPIMLRFMGQSEYGLYSLVASVVGYLTVLDMGLGNATVRYTAKYRMAQDKDSEYNLNGMFLILYTGIGIIAAIMGGFLYINVENIFRTSLSNVELEKAKVMIILLVFNVTISFPLGIFGSIMTAYERFIFPKIVNIIRVLINPCIMILLLLIGYRSVAMVLVTTILNIICLLCNAWYCFQRLKIKIKFLKFEWNILREICGYSFFVFLNVIVDKIYWSTDQFILGIVSNTATIAVYAIASQISMYYMSFSTAMSGVFLPRVTVMVSQEATDEQLSDIFIRIGRLQYILLGLILSGFMLFGKQFITIWAGEQYKEGFYMAIVMMIPLTIPLIQTLGITILQAKNIHKFRSMTYLGIAIMNIFISIKLGTLWGGFGCALATGISMIIGHFIIMNIYYYKRVNIDIFKFWKNIIKLTIPILVSIIIGVLIRNSLRADGVINLVISIMIFTVVYILFMWKLGMNTYEKEIFIIPLRKGYLKIKARG